MSLLTRTSAKKFNIKMTHVKSLYLISYSVCNSLDSIHKVWRCKSQMKIKRSQRKRQKEITENDVIKYSQFNLATEKTLKLNT